MKRPLTNLAAGILLTVATAGPASAICLDSTVSLDKANTASVVRAVKEHLKENGNCGSGMIVDKEHNTLGWYTVDELNRLLRITPYNSRVQSQSVSYDNRRD